jgi:hypothetical protein
MRIRVSEEIVETAMRDISHALDAFCQDHRTDEVRAAIARVSMLALPDVAEQLALLWRDALYAAHELGLVLDDEEPVANQNGGHVTNPLADEHGGPFRSVDVGHPDANRVINRARAEMDTSEPRWWWLIFHGSEQHEFLGAAAVKAPNMVMAIQEAWRLGCNPGGQTAGTGLPDGVEVPPEKRERLLQDPEAAEVAALLRGHPAHGGVGRNSDDEPA